MSELIEFYLPARLDKVRDAVRKCGFDAKTYLALNGDLKACGLNADQAFNHYLRYGIFESRNAPTAGVIRQFADLAALGIRDEKLRSALFGSLMFNGSKVDAVLEDNWQLDAKRDLLPLRDAGMLPFLIYGDSHAKAYWKPTFHEGKMALPVLLQCAAGSARGLANSESRLGYGARISGHEARLSGLPVFFKFGQVDAEFVSVFHRVRQFKTEFQFSDFETFTRNSLFRYIEFLKDQAAVIGAGRMRVCSIFPPALSDDQWRQGYVNAHVGHLEKFTDMEALSAAIMSLELPDQRTRTRMHAFYNQEMAEHCRRLGITFIDDFTPMVGDDGLIRPELVAEHGGIDHHLSTWVAGPTVMALAAPYAA